MGYTKSFGSLGAVAATLVAATLVAFPAQAQETMPEDTPSEDKCAALHLVLVNGTFDTGRGRDSATDHGFGAQIAVPAMKQANGEVVEDPTAGITMESAQGQLDVLEAELAEAGTAGESSSTTSVEESSESLWGGQTTSSTQTAPSSDVWGAAGAATPTEKPDLWGGGETTTSSTETAEETAVTDPWTTETQVDETTGQMARTYIPYAAGIGGAFIPGVSETEAISYDDSMIEGAKNTAAVLQTIATECPETKVFLAGHSQGAQVVSAVARTIGSGASDFPADKIAGVALFSDPTREVASPTMTGGKTGPAPVPGTQGTQVSQLGDFQSPDAAELDGGGLGVDSTNSDGFGALADRTASWCVPGDLVCDLPISGSLSKLVINTAQKLDISDPEKSLQAVADTLSPAVVMGGVNDIETEAIDYGQGGFSASATRLPAQQKSLVGSISEQGTREAQTKVDSAVIGDLGESVIAGVNQLGGMALGTGISIVKEAVTVDNLAQVAAAGVAGPQAAMGVAAGKLAEASLKILTPETAVGMAEEVFSSVEGLGLSGEGLAQVAVEAAGHGAAHNAYNSHPATADGRSAIEATVDWTVAASGDLSGKSTEGAGAAQAPQKSLEPVQTTQFDADAARAAMAQLTGAEGNK